MLCLAAWQEVWHSEGPFIFLMAIRSHDLRFLLAHNAGVPGVLWDLPSLFGIFKWEVERICPGEGFLGGDFYQKGSRSEVLSRE